MVSVVYRHKSPPRGITLVEMIVALGIFAIVSMLGYKALQVFQYQERNLTAHQQQLADISILIGLLERDLRDAQEMAGRSFQHIQSRAFTNQHEFLFASQAKTPGHPHTFIRWVIDNQSVRRYSDSGTNRVSQQWQGKITTIRLFAIQAGKKREWSQLDTALVLQGIEFRIELEKNLSISRVVAITGSGATL